MKATEHTKCNRLLGFCKTLENFKMNSRFFFTKNTLLSRLYVLLFMNFEFTKSTSCSSRYVIGAAESAGQRDRTKSNTF